MRGRYPVIMNDEIIQNEEAPGAETAATESPEQQEAAENLAPRGETAEGLPVAEPATPEVALKGRGRRSEKIGIVTSDKMMKTVVVRVDRLVKHPVYKRYVRQRSKFMAHNEIEGVTIGDQVRIVETRPLSAHKRWRVVEVLRKASK